MGSLFTNVSTNFFIKNLEGGARAPFVVPPLIEVAVAVAVAVTVTVAKKKKIVLFIGERKIAKAKGRLMTGPSGV